MKIGFKSIYSAPTKQKLHFGKDEDAAKQRANDARVLAAANNVLLDPQSGQGIKAVAKTTVEKKVNKN